MVVTPGGMTQHIARGAMLRAATVVIYLSRRDRHHCEERKRMIAVRGHLERAARWSTFRLSRSVARQANSIARVNARELGRVAAPLGLGCKLKWPPGDNRGRSRAAPSPAVPTKIPTPDVGGP